jgi:hypothetical protein
MAEGGMSDINGLAGKEPPVVLVKTWVELIKSSEVEEVKSHAWNRLIDAFGGPEEAFRFCKENGIVVNS